MTEPLDGKALHRLGIQRNPGNLPDFIEALESPASACRIMAVRAISWLREPSLGVHLRPLVTDPDQAVRDAVMAGFAVLGDLDAEPYLCRALGADSSPSVRATAARTLGWLRLTGTAPMLMTTVREDHDDDVVAQSIRALGRLAHHPAWDVIIEAAAAPSVMVRRAAVSALGALQSKTMSESNGHRLDPLRARLTDPDAETRALALRALSICRAPDAGTLGMAALEDPNPGVRVTAAIALRRLGKPEMADLLRGHEFDPHPEVAQQIRKTRRHLVSLRSPTKVE